MRVLNLEPELMLMLRRPVIISVTVIQLMIKRFRTPLIQWMKLLRILDSVEAEMLEDKSGWFKLMPRFQSILMNWPMVTVMTIKKPSSSTTRLMQSLT